VRGGAQAHAVGFGLHGAVLHHGDARTKWIADAAGALLHDVRQFVVKKLLPLRGGRVVLSRCEIQIRAVREGQGTDRRRLRSDMDPHIREAGLEEGLHLLLDGFGQGLAAAARFEREIPRQREGVTRVGLHGCRCRPLPQDRLGCLGAKWRRGLKGAGLHLGREDRPGGLTGAEQRLKSASRRTAGQERSRRKARAGLDRGRHLRPDRRHGRGRRLDDARASAGEETLDDARRGSGVGRRDRTG